jgi:hypothetical protein
VSKGVRIPGDKDANFRHLWLLRARRERPRCRTAKQRPQASKFRVQSYRSTFSHSLGHEQTNRARQCRVCLCPLNRLLGSGGLEPRQVPQLRQRRLSAHSLRIQFRSTNARSPPHWRARAQHHTRSSRADRQPFWLLLYPSNPVIGFTSALPGKIFVASICSSKRRWSLSRPLSTARRSVVGLRSRDS